MSCKIIYVEGIYITGYDISSDRCLSLFHVLNVVLIRNLECATSSDERQKGTVHILRNHDLRHFDPPAPLCNQK